ncbi:hypothetical protein JTB14_009650 [Gonioctena quinquepunctata]|nr:hypothetical protein JTB14_009650 [Gonioctena quinquepunctata]
MVGDPTRITQHSSTILDCVCQNFSYYETNSLVTPVGFSDHEALPTSCKIVTTKKKRKVRLRRIYSKKNFECFNYYSQNYPEKWGILITLNVKNAFNSLPWSNIKKLLKKLRTPQYLLNILDDYLLNRGLDIGNSEIVEVTAGVRQGSVLGPTLWNVSYDEVLRKSYPEGVEAVAFADDLALIVRANSEYELKHKAEIAIEIVENCIEENGLTLAKHKTETVVLKSPRNKDNIIIRAEETSLQPVKHLKYLGITEREWRLGKKIRKNIHNIEDHAKYQRTEQPKKKHVTRSSQICPTVRDTAWHPILEKVTYKNLLTKVERKSLLCICSAYRTTSTKALNVVAGEIPLYLLAKERHRLNLRDEVNQQAKK